MLADDSGEPWDGRRFEHSKTVAKVVPEAEGLLGAGFHKPQEGIAAVAACI